MHWELNSDVDTTVMTEIVYLLQIFTSSLPITLQHMIQSGLISRRNCTVDMDVGIVLALHLSCSSQEMMARLQTLLEEQSNCLMLILILMHLMTHLLKLTSICSTVL
ncbi:hypothetical protein CRE_26514 [Caenorhabditis remanei]|uniref:Uncharacterized protein n=1 Tax=Caenorhabditis remanei TaxID=31234 RepID=E3LQZ2_CAERE|nr:hypothetical protein CRE_26514 [Caenorhabditis remanei]